MLKVGEEMKSIKAGDVFRENRGVTVPISARTKNLVDIFNLNNIQSIVVLKEERAAGLVMRDKLFYRLGSRFGYNLYMQKNVNAVMDSKPLIIDFDESVLKVSKIAMRRPQEKSFLFFIWILIILKHIMTAMVIVKEMRLLITLRKYLITVPEKLWVRLFSVILEEMIL
ncbi:hypothetical protein C8C76_1546 [Halanaerobium saccharolyticum]|uniref:CBS domain protein n=1 Tax=Halanaerobium saccharolyticum TaxID=43595 RepID=A0A2T5RFG8_9FIRM|nr:hypothetical protein C8C76_1546 [Halanaerobium saccharolyticum]PUU93872.1 MAG: diguanylate cyclase/phosphodiesterase [Halanaerobium sp.]PUU94255.1 MAG: diguanylate cyclase/phosphodiesterase [Halanaerobium sp.]TDP89008.1 hypothetical protein C7957_1276 [Halanaerobium saccharolyticum]